MAIGDKKSLLQPSSVQAQQYRLQFTNLQPVSAFARSPVPASGPIPIPAVSQTPAAVASTFRQAAFFDGATVYSASLVGGNDFIFEGTPTDSTRSFSVDLIFKPAAPDSLRHTIFHTYSGSFMSQSLELYTTGSNLIVEYTNGTVTINKQVVEYRVSFYYDLNFFANIGWTGHMTNGFTYFSTRGTVPGSNNQDGHIKFKANTFRKQVEYLAGYIVGIPNSFNTANNTHFYIGGSPAKNSYYSGSIASITFATGSFFTNQQWGDMALRDLNPTTISPQLRTYTFNSTSAEFTGSQASFSRPLVLVAGTPSYVDSYLKL